MVEIYDAQTGEYTIREMTDAEIQEIEAVINAIEATVNDDPIGF